MEAGIGWQNEHKIISDTKINETFADSHYQPLPSCAGNFYLIDLVDEIRCYNWGADSAGIDYAIIAENRQKILQKAFERFQICRRRSDMGKSSIWLGCDGGWRI